ncbi:MAG: hypothetical protein ACR2IE_00405 [Candidatus Sumerlaeaceae bacterium]
MAAKSCRAQKRVQRFFRGGVSPAPVQRRLPNNFCGAGDNAAIDSYEEWKHLQELLRGSNDECLITS